jgi:hypothetical protein
MNFPFLFGHKGNRVTEVTFILLTRLSIYIISLNKGYIFGYLSYHLDISLCNQKGYKNN